MGIEQTNSQTKTTLPLLSLTAREKQALRLYHQPYTSDSSFSHNYLLQFHPSRLTFIRKNMKSKRLVFELLPVVKLLHSISRNQRSYTRSKFKLSAPIFISHSSDDNCRNNNYINNFHLTNLSSLLLVLLNSCFGCWQGFFGTLIKSESSLSHQLRKQTRPSPSHHHVIIMMIVVMMLYFLRRIRDKKYTCFRYSNLNPLSNLLFCFGFLSPLSKSRHSVSVSQQQPFVHESHCFFMSTEKIPVHTTSLFQHLFSANLSNLLGEIHLFHPMVINGSTSNQLTFAGSFLKTAVKHGTSENVRYLIVWESKKNSLMSMNTQLAQYSDYD